MRLLNKAEALHLIDTQAAVFDAAANPCNPFASSVWLRHFIAEVARDDWTLVAAEHGASLMLLYREAGAPSRWLSVANYYASLSSPVASRESDRRPAIAALLDDLAPATRRAATLTLSPLDAESADTRWLAEGLSERGWYLRRFFCFGNWTMPCDGLSFDAYMAGRDSQLRNTFSRKARKLLAAGTIEVATRPEEVDAAMDAYDAVYARSWKEPEPYPNFVRGWARRCAEQGWLRLGVARIDGDPIAAQFWFTTGRRAYIFKLAYDEAQSKWSAGTVLTAHLMRQALDVDRVIEIDYLTGDDAYKRSWMTHRRERIGLMACNLRTVGGLVAAAGEVAGEARARLRARRASAAASTSSHP